MIRRLKRKLARSVRRRGLAKTIGFCFVTLFAWPARLARVRASQGRQFDREHNVDTGGEVELSGLRIDSPNRDQGSPYCSIPQTLFGEMLSVLSIRHEDFTFIDIGSGKGRILFFAAEYPFKRIIGVEFSPELHEVAQRNLHDFRSREQKCWNLQTLCMDAVEFHIPEEPLVIFLQNPFVGNVMARTLANIEESLRTHPREVYVIYYNPTEGHMFDASNLLRSVKARKARFTEPLTVEYSIYGAALSDRLERATVQRQAR